MAGIGKLEVVIFDNVVDTVTANMSDDAMNYAIEAVCDACNYVEGQTDSDGNPVTKARFFSWMFRKWVEDQVARYARKQSAIAAQAAVDAMLNTVVVPN